MTKVYPTTVQKHIRVLRTGIKQPLNKNQSDADSAMRLMGADLYRKDKEHFMAHARIVIISRKRVAGFQRIMEALTAINDNCIDIISKAKKEKNIPAQFAEDITIMCNIASILRIQSFEKFRKDILCTLYNKSAIQAITGNDKLPAIIKDAFLNDIVTEQEFSALYEEFASINPDYSKIMNDSFGIRVAPPNHQLFPYAPTYPSHPPSFTAANQKSSSDIPTYPSHPPSFTAANQKSSPDIPTYPSHPPSFTAANQQSSPDIPTYPSHPPLFTAANQKSSSDIPTYPSHPPLFTAANQKSSPDIPTYPSHPPSFSAANQQSSPDIPTYPSHPPLFTAANQQSSPDIPTYPSHPPSFSAANQQSSPDIPTYPSHPPLFSAANQQSSPDIPTYPSHPPSFTAANQQSSPDIPTYPSHPPSFTAANQKSSSDIPTYPSHPPLFTAANQQSSPDIPTYLSHPPLFTAANQQSSSDIPTYPSHPPLFSAANLKSSPDSPKAAQPTAFTPFDASVHSGPTPDIHQASGQINSSQNLQAFINESRNEVKRLNEVVDAQESLINNYRLEIESLKQKIREQDQIIHDLEERKPIHEEASKQGMTILDSDEIDQLTKLDELGHGSSGTVYKVSKTVTKNEIYVLKVMTKMSQDNFRNFIKEYEILSMLHHPNVLKTYGIFFSDEKSPPSILLEYCSNDIVKMIKNKMFSKCDIVFIVYQIAEGMKYVHSRNIIHRDLKPSNILVDENRTIKICDFGISKIMTVEEQQTTMTSGIGTLYFMAPEIINNQKYDTKVDVYSFGIVTYFILSGGQFPRWTIGQMVTGAEVPIPEYFTSLAKSLVRSCLQLDPNVRPNFSTILENIKKYQYELLDLSPQEKVEVKNRIEQFQRRIPSY
ncbi:hypothetical protein M9Y10_037585 [Tritrichomonas musculus]|uniref:Protein kinase domain-containing protein n=1 Tax=Tritrichomonas musculus TaxID=1915356 RepID=A0ABR2GRW8_9EUKA